MKGWEHNWANRVKELKEIEYMVETIVRFPLINELFPVDSVELDAAMKSNKYGGQITWYVVDN